MSTLCEKLHLTSCDYPPDTPATPEQHSCILLVESRLLLHHDRPQAPLMGGHAGCR